MSESQPRPNEGDSATTPDGATPCGMCWPGHVPFYLRINHALKRGGREVCVLRVDPDGTVQVKAGKAEVALWTHPRAVALLDALVASGLDEGVLYDDILIIDGYSTSLTDADEASPCSPG